MTVYAEPFTSSVENPVIIPFVVLNSRPPGSEGEIDHEETFPPNICGTMYTSSTFVVRLSSLSR